MLWRDKSATIWRHACLGSLVIQLGLAGSSVDATEPLSVFTNQYWGDPHTVTRDEVIRITMIPYRGKSVTGVDVSTMDRKILCGYQGWFAAAGDDSGRGWAHWAGRDGFRPGSCSIDLWPDVSELDPDERYATEFRHRDGRAAEVFSSFNRKTVLRHFQWMETYGIDGVFVQRFVVELGTPAGLRHANVVLNHCREGANLSGRAYAVMYDLSGLGSNQMNRVKEDWRLLVDRMQITRDPAYLHHKGKPVVAIWGFGFNDNRRYTVAEGIQIVEFLKNDPAYGGCTVMLGLPTYWRTLDRDCVNDPRLHELARMADVISPWTVGRFSTPAQARRYAETTLTADLEWCRGAGIDYMPVAFPGFSWHNMKPGSPLNQIPRLRGEFLWSQFAAVHKAGATMIYQAMFDEVDEGTAIFKCTDDPPVGESRFVDLEGLPSDFYLKLVGAAGRMLRGELEPSERIPAGLR